MILDQTKRFWAIELIKIGIVALATFLVAGKETAAQKRIAQFQVFLAQPLLYQCGPNFDQVRDVFGGGRKILAQTGRPLF